jgi:hypothetical protein
MLGLPLLILLTMSTQASAQQPSDGAATDAGTRGVECLPSSPEAPVDSAMRSEAVQRLLVESERDAALCELLRSSGYFDETGYKEEPRVHVNHVVEAPQEAGAPLYMVFKAEDHDSGDGGHGKAKGHFLLFDAEGNRLQLFENANVAGDDTELLELGPGKPLALVLTFELEGDLQSLHIVPVTPEQKSVLSLVLGPPGERVVERVVETPVKREEIGHMSLATGGPVTFMKNIFSWGWRVRPSGAGRFPRIEIGPKKALARGRPAAVFVWSTKRRSYVGPSGSGKQQFLRIDGVPSKRPGPRSSASRRSFQR